MKSIIVAAALALAAVPTLSTASQAASVTITTTDRTVHHYDRGLHRGWDRGRHYGWRHHARRDCYVKKVRYHHHGKLVIATKRICR